MLYIVLGLGAMHPGMEKFQRWAFFERRELLEKMIEHKADRFDFTVGFTRHNPAFISYGPAGLNGSIKGVGYVHKPEFLHESIEKMKERLTERPDMFEAARFLRYEIYDENKVDFSLLTSLELARKHTYENVKAGSDITLLYYMPVSTSYEVRCEAELHEEGPYYEFANALHDVFHGKRERWSPTYVLRIKEIYDNSERVMGERIYP